MSKAIVIGLALLGLVALSGDGFAQQKKCPKGKVYNAKTEKCVTPPRAPGRSAPRGSS